MFGKGSRCIVGRDEPESVSVPTEDIAEIGAAYSCGILQHRVKDRLQIAWRTRNDSQHFGSGDLLLAGLSEFASKDADLLSQLGNQ